MAPSDKDDEIDRERALYEVGWATRELVANCLRVMRGAGRPQALFDQFNAINEAVAGSKLTVFDVCEAMEDALQLGLRETGPTDTFDNAVLNMERGAARAMAARLLDQPLQVTAGRRDFLDAFYTLERIREDNRKRHQAAPPRTPAAAKPKKTRKDPTAQTKPPRKPAPAPQAAEEDIDPRSWKTTAEYMNLRREQLLRQRQAAEAEGE